MARHPRASKKAPIAAGSGTGANRCVVFDKIRVSPGWLPVLEAIRRSIDMTSGEDFMEYGPTAVAAEVIVPDRFVPPSELRLIGVNRGVDEVDGT